jgi:hypothetical protein
MLKTSIVTATMAVLLAAAPAFAQSPRAEVGVLFGWTFADGVSAETPVLGGDGNIYDRVDPTDSFHWGLQAGGFVSDNIAVGFLWTQQLSQLEVSGTNTRTLGDMTVSTYHGYVEYNGGASDASVRPYLLFGLGATNYGTLNFTTLAGQQRELGGDTQFSGTIGAGVKVYPTPKAGFRFGARWTPTYIKSDSEGWWCDPYWGCYVVGDAQYSNQFELNAGVTFRF